MGAGALPGGHLTPEHDLPTGPRGAHLEMVGAVLAGEGLERIAEIASAHAGAPVAVIVPRLGPAPAAWEECASYVSSKLGGGRPEPPPALVAEVAVASGSDVLGAVLLLGPGRPDAGEFLHVAAVAALTEVAVADAREETELAMRGSFLEELLAREELDGPEVLRRAARLGCDLSDGFVAICADPLERAPGRIVALIAAERPGSLAQVVDGRVRALLPGGADAARPVAARVGRAATVGMSSAYASPSDARRALEEAELVLEVTAAGGAPPAEGGVGGGTYRLLFRVLASHPDEVRTFYQDTVAPLVAYDDQYSTDMLGTLAAYLDHNCNMNATATAIHAHRHTVAYRLDRVRELTGLDPSSSEDRERLGLGLKAHRIIAPLLPR